MRAKRQWKRFPARSFGSSPATDRTESAMWLDKRGAYFSDEFQRRRHEAHEEQFSFIRNSSRPSCLRGLFFNTRRLRGRRLVDGHLIFLTQRVLQLLDQFPLLLRFQV